jgi:nucleoside-diphosphate-sugar epimerase
MYGDGLQTRTNTYVTDCVAGTLLALDRGTLGEAYNVGGGVSVSMLEVVDLLGDLIGCTPRLEFSEARPGDQRDTRADIGKAARELGYQPAVGPLEGLGRQVEWHRQHVR